MSCYLSLSHTHTAIASIFSPLDSNVTLTRPNASVATPTLQSMHNPSLPLSSHPKTMGASSESLETIQENSSTIPSDSTAIIKEHPPANSLFEGTSSLLVSTLPSQLQHPQIQSTPTVPLVSSNIPNNNIILITSGKIPQKRSVQSSVQFTCY